MSVEEVSWATVIREALEQSSADIGVCAPARVVSYSRATQTAQVHFLVTQRAISPDDEDVDVFTKIPDAYSVPVVWPGGGSSYFHPELSAGDEVLVVCSDSDFSGWRSSGAESNPVDARQHHYGKCFAIPGARSLGKVLPDTEAVLVAGGSFFHAAIAERLALIFDTFSTGLSAAGSTPQTGATIKVIWDAAVAAADGLGGINSAKIRMGG